MKVTLNQNGGLVDYVNVESATYINTEYDPDTKDVHITYKEMDSEETVHGARIVEVNAEGD